MEFCQFLSEQMEQSNTLTLSQTDYNYYIPKKIRLGKMRWPDKIH